MPRKPRESSGTGIYHVMLRGINRQDIFEDADHGDRSLILFGKRSITSPLDRAYKASEELLPLTNESPNSWGKILRALSNPILCDIKNILKGNIHMIIN
jgi:hypothetical protein